MLDFPAYANDREGLAMSEFHHKAASVSAGVVGRADGVACAGCVACAGGDRHERHARHGAPRELWPFSFGAAIFDFDGTIARSGHVWSQVDHVFLESRGIEWTPDLSAELASRGFSKGAEYVIERYGLDETPEAICREWDAMGSELYPRLVELRPGAEKYVRSLRAAGVPCALATTNDSRVLGSLAPRIDVEGLFDTVVYGTDVTRDKNHPDIYLEAARRLGVSASSCVAFEDIAAALRSARAAGMATCAVCSGDETQDVSAVSAAADMLLCDWRDLAC